MRKLFTLAVLSMLTSFLAHAQSEFNLRNDAVDLGDRCFRLTENKVKAMGAFWSKKPINLNQSFDLLTRIYFGSNNNGGDGLAFVICGSDNYINDGGKGSDFGAFGIVPALSVEFDNLQSAGNNDPSYDHLSIIKDNIFAHNSGNSLTSPVQTSQSSNNVEDGKEHTVRFNWNATTKIFRVYVDCVERASLTNDVVKNIFNNQPIQYWGFTGACGTQTNEQRVCIERMSSLDQYNEKLICQGETASLFSAHQANGVVKWTPNDGTLSNNTIFNPIASPLKSTLYIAENAHACNLTFKDTFKINVPQLKPLAFPKNTELCEKETLKAAATAQDGKFYTWNPVYSDSVFTITKAGTYKVTISDGTCFWKDSVTVTYNPLPKVYLGKDTTICANKTVTLNATNPNATYAWSNGGTDAQTAVSQSDNYWVEVTSDKGCKASDTIKIATKPIFNTVKTIEICQGDFYTFAGVKYFKDTTVCVVYNAKNACDSTHCLTIKTKSVSTFAIQKEICQGDFFQFNQKKYTQSGIYLDTLVAKNGCDSIVTITLNTIATDTVAVTEMICENGTFTIANQSFSKAGKYSVKLKDLQTGCDSFVNLTLKVIPLRGFVGKDTICEGETLKFGTQTLFKSGFYDEKLKNKNGCDSLVEMTLWVVPTPKVKITTTKAAFCKDGSTTLFANSAVTQNFTWSDGSKNKNLTTRTSGTYKVFINGLNGCKGSDSIVVNESKPMSLDLQIVPPSCSGYSDGKIIIKDVTGGLGAFSAKIDNEKFTSTLNFSKLKENVYTIVVKDTVGCEVTEKVALLNPKPKSIQIADKSREILLGDSTIVEIIPSFSDIVSMAWTPNEKIEEITDLEFWLKPTENKMYKITVKDSAGCVLSDSITINVKDTVNIFVPNIFSPNLDGTNDELKAFASYGIEKIMYFGVFDHWGNQVYEAKDYRPMELKSWDGTFINRELEQGVYTYNVRVLKKNQKEQWFRGEVMLMR